jgi:hypothetical protein
VIQIKNSEVIFHIDHLGLTVLHAIPDTHGMYIDQFTFSQARAGTIHSLFEQVHHRFPKH